MTRGPPPLQAISKAREIAAAWGEIREGRALARSRYSFIVFCRSCTRFIRVKRIRMHISDPHEILRIYRQDILQLRTLPSTPVTSREIWTLSPWGTWQYFQVTDTGLTEIRHECEAMNRDVPAIAGLKPAVPVSLGAVDGDTGTLPGPATIHRDAGNEPA